MISNILGTILAPLSRVISYAMIKLMKKMRAPDDKRPIIAASDYLLNNIILPSSFKTFRDAGFRTYARFNKIPAAEHDRIFNELGVAGVCLASFYIRAVKQIVYVGDYHFWQDVEEYLPRQFQKILMGYGVDGANAKLMRELIAMRCKEYEQLAEYVWEESDRHHKEFQSLPGAMKHLGAGMQATAIGTAGHIMRGRIKKGDPLTQFLIVWLIMLKRKVHRFVKWL